MPTDSQLSTILLLCVLAFVIYQLSNASCLNNESFADTKGDVLPLKEIYNSGNFTPEKQNVVSNNLTLNSAQPLQSAPVNTMNTVSSQPSEMKQMNTEAKNDQPVVNSFGGNDLSLSGADLDGAYANPLPAGVTADTLNLNKNNVTNYNSKDFLPKEVNDEWFDTDFSQAKHNIKDDKLINTERYIIGVNTVGQSLKNASYDIRGTIPNPKFSVSPWNNSTYEPDYNLKPLC